MAFALTFDRATTPTRGPQPGAVNLYRFILGSPQWSLATGLGIYNNRKVRNGSSLSVHAEGRALDIGFPVERPNGHPEGNDLATALVVNHRNLGIQQVIWAGRIWSNYRADEGWRKFSNSSGDHFDHIHLELQRSAAEYLTTNMIEEALMALTAAEKTMLAEVHQTLVGHVQAGPHARAGSVHDLATPILMNNGTTLRLEAGIKAVRAAIKDLDIPISGPGESDDELADAIVAAIIERLSS